MMDEISQRPLLEVCNINKSYGEGDNRFHVLFDINLSIVSGEMVAIIGQSGSGKSTLMNIMACLDKPTTGEYYINGQSTSQMSGDELAELRRDRFGFIFQRYQLLTSLTAQDNVAVPAIYAGTPQHIRQQKAKQLLIKLGLQERIFHYPNQLSGGQQQRVSIARALMNGGQIIFADEPTGALDSQSSRDVMSILTELNREGHTIILVTHDSKVASHASRIIEISDGRIVSDTKQALSSQTSSNERSESQPINFSSVSHSKKISPLLYALSSVKEAFHMAILTMLANKMRTLLTMLGIIIGITSVVLIVALGNGAKQKILKEISSVGTAKLMIFAGNPDEDKNNSQQVDTLTFEDMKVLAEQPYVSVTSPTLTTTMNAQVGNQERTAQVEGASSNKAALENVKFISGKMISEEDIATNQLSIVIEKKVGNVFFPHQSALGQTILLNGVPCQVVGIFKVEGYDDNQNSLRIWMPYTTLQTRFVGQSSRIDGINVGVKQGYGSKLAQENVSRLLMARHGKKDFTIINSDSIAKAVEKTAQNITLLISAIAVISLLVGGIGVMNIMLVSVTERTGEIGVRMAVGARYQDIVQQFLIEAMMVCFIGGMLGVIFAFGFGTILELFNIHVIFSMFSIVVAVICSTLIGLIFGLMPAHRAANMNPIDALNKV